MGIRRMYALDLHDDASLIAQYRAWHAPGAVPQGVIDAILASGVRLMEIYLTGNRLFMITESDPQPADHRSGAVAGPETEAWEALMWTFQKPLPWCKPGQKWVEADQIFQLQRDASPPPAPSPIGLT